MARDKEILREATAYAIEAIAEDHYGNDITGVNEMKRDAFIKGAEWAYAHPSINSKQKHIMTDEEEEDKLFNQYLQAKESEKQPLTDAQKNCDHKWYKTWTWHSGGFQQCVLCKRVETFYERD